jgi:hypothetical protein
VKSTNLVVYNHYWGTYSRLLGKQNGFSIELNLFPVNRDWSRVKPEMIRKHCTQRDQKDKIMHHKFVPEEIVKTIKANIGSDFAHKLMTFDYLGEMYNIFGVSNIEDLYQALTKVPNNGGMKWADICEFAGHQDFNGTAVEIGAKVGCAPENYPDPNTFYKAICWRMEGRKCFVNEMTFMVWLMDTIYV